MTTAELIALLQRLPQNAHIYTWDWINGAYDELNKNHIMYTEENIIYL